MNTKFLKKVGKLLVAGAVAGLGMLAGDRIADDKSALGDFGFGKDDDSNNDNDTVKMPDITEEAEKFTEEDIAVEDVKEEKESE